MRLLRYGRDLLVLSGGLALGVGLTRLLLIPCVIPLPRVRVTPAVQAVNPSEVGKVTSHPDSYTFMCDGGRHSRPLDVSRYPQYTSVTGVLLP